MDFFNGECNEEILIHITLVRSEAVAVVAFIITEGLAECTNAHASSKIFGKTINLPVTYF